MIRGAVAQRQSFFLDSLSNQPTSKGCLFTMEFRWASQKMFAVIVALCLMDSRLPLYETNRCSFGLKVWLLWLTTILVSSSISGSKSRLKQAQVSRKKELQLQRNIHPKTFRNVLRRIYPHRRGLGSPGPVRPHGIEGGGGPLDGNSGREAGARSVRTLQVQAQRFQVYLASRYLCLC